jgi:hypothetical protein
MTQPKAPIPIPVPELPVVQTVTAGAYRAIRRATQTAREDAGTAQVTRANRPRWWARRPRPTCQIAFPEEMYARIVAVAAQDGLSLAATVRSLIALGLTQYNHVISERIGNIVSAQRDC